MLICLGANKAGTSWLYRYLAGHPDCRLPLVKELHYFDARHFNRLEGEQQRITALHDATRDALASAKGAEAEKLRAELTELNEWLSVIAAARAGKRGDAAYRDFVLGRAAGGARLVADITPAYALMPKRVFVRMQALAEKVRFLYILRDPVDRLWSNIRMNAARLAGGTGTVAEEALRQFDLWVAGEAKSVSRRSDYAATLARLAEAVDPAKLSVIFYETLFTPAALGRLCGFLGIGAHPAQFSKLVHVGVPVPLDAARQAQARAILAPQYDYVRRTVADLPPRWRENMGEM